MIERERNEPAAITSEQVRALRELYRRKHADISGKVMYTDENAKIRQLIVSARRYLVWTGIPIRERWVLELLHGLITPASPREIGNILELPDEQIIKLDKEAQEKLQASLVSKRRRR